MQYSQYDHEVGFGKPDRTWASLRTSKLPEENSNYGLLEVRDPVI